MLFLKQDASVLAKALYSTVIRKLSPHTSKPTLILLRCPCLTCSVKIAQVGISEVVYSKDYAVDSVVRSQTCVCID
jgi:deoxycytidylate deaminase